MVNVYKCLFTGDEVVSSNDGVTDTWNEKSFGDVALFAIPVKKTFGGEDYGIGDDDDGEEAGETKYNLIGDYFLEKTDKDFKKKDFVAWAKAYLKKLKKKVQEDDPEAVSAFKTNAAAFLKWLVSISKDCNYYYTQSCDPDGIMVVEYWYPDGADPVFIYWRHGLKVEKY